MSEVVPFAAAREALLARLTEQLPPSSEWAGRLMLMPEGRRVEPMPAADAVESLRAFRAGLGEAVGAAACSVGGVWVGREDCLDWDGLLAPLAVAAAYVVGRTQSAGGFAAELFRCKDALAGWACAACAANRRWRAPPAMPWCRSAAARTTTRSCWTG